MYEGKIGTEYLSNGWLPTILLWGHSRIYAAKDGRCNSWDSPRRNRGTDSLTLFQRKSAFPQ